MGVRPLREDMTKGTSSFGKRHNKSHTVCRRCGKRSYHIQKKTCACCGYPSARIRSYNWSVKAIRRRTTGSGRMRYMKHLHSLGNKCTEEDSCGTRNDRDVYRCI